MSYLQLHGDTTLARDLGFWWNFEHSEADFPAPFKHFYRASGAPSAALINTDICDVLFSIQISFCSVLIYHHSVKPTRLQFIQVCVFVQKRVGWTAPVFLSFRILLPSFPFSTHLQWEQHFTKHHLWSCQNQQSESSNRQAVNQEKSLSQLCVNILSVSPALTRNMHMLVEMLHVSVTQKWLKYLILPWTETLGVKYYKYYILFGYILFDVDIFAVHARASVPGRAGQLELLYHPPTYCPKSYSYKKACTFPEEKGPYGPQVKIQFFPQHIFLGGLSNTQP